MVRGKEDINKEVIMASIKILSETSECKKPKRLKFFDSLLATLVYGIIASGIVITIISVTNG